MTLPEGSRVAVYYAPAPDDDLARLSAAWLGRDPGRAEPQPRPDIRGLDAVTDEPGLYGFHATLKPPMRLRPGVDWDALADAARELAASIAAFDLPPLAVAELHGFLALRETVPSPQLQALADLCVAGLDEFRALPTCVEFARRCRAGLSIQQQAMLRRWGYPYVFGTWFFHMTLTRRLTSDETAHYRPAAERYFAAALRQPRRVADICLFTQAAPGQPFRIAARLPLAD
ncbi:MAG TPA: DUF1045 domain-containing protein [Acetobacteraceae bacterium]|nr:DUF1045 domain-containing protein [Acetobacteraceae bacterium]